MTNKNITKKDLTKNIEEEIPLKTCFIVTPIGEPNSEINRKAFGLINAVLKPTLEKFSYRPIAASDISIPGSINKQIIIRLHDDELVIANLTGLNPNVMYELAVRHAVKKTVIIMAEKGTQLPFDLVDQRCIFYEDNLHGVEEAKNQLSNFLSSALSESNVTNPIYDALNESQIIKHISNSDDPAKYMIERMDRIEKYLVGLLPQSDKQQLRSTVKVTYVFTLDIEDLNNFNFENDIEPFMTNHLSDGDSWQIFTKKSDSNAFKFSVTSSPSSMNSFTNALNLKGYKYMFTKLL